MRLHEAFSPEESKKIYDNFLAIVNDPKRRDRLVRKHGKNAENVAYGTAVNQVKKQAANTIEEPQPEETMEDTRLREMVIDALTEKKKSFPDLTGDGKVTRADILKARGVELDEDLDLGHTDDEPHMLKAELAQIGKYAMELYKMVDQFEGPQEVDFPHWWQAKIVTAKNMISSAKHYLEFELEEPKIDAMVESLTGGFPHKKTSGEDFERIDITEPMDDATKNKMIRNFRAAGWDAKPNNGGGITAIKKAIMDEAKEGAIDEMSKKQIKKRGKIFDALKAQGMSDEKAGRIATAQAQKIKEAILAKLKNK